MTDFNYALDIDRYSWTNAAFWGNCIAHYKKAHEARGCERFVHLLIAAIELLPIISQIASIFEKLIVTGYSQQLQKPFQRHSLSLHPEPNMTRLNIWSVLDIRQYHHTLAVSPMVESPLLTWSNWSHARIMPSMDGMEKIASALIKKHHLNEKELTVCKTLENLRLELEKIHKEFESINDFHRAFVVPTRSTQWGVQKNGHIPNRTDSTVVHMLAVVVEKKHGLLHIALLDSMIRHGNEVIDPTHVGLGKEFAVVPYTEQELVLSHIFEVGFNPAITVLYHSNVLREKSNGCWAFALKDSIAFLKTPNLLCEIHTLDRSHMLHNLKLKRIETLPVQFIVTAQFSIQEFNAYFRQHP